MQTALYHPEHGYYAKGETRVGRKGDFITSVSVGSAFGCILAHRIHKVWLDLGQPTDFTIVEMGANNGDLAVDISKELGKLIPESPGAWRYAIIEPMPLLRIIQREKFKAAEIESICIHESLDSLAPVDGVFLTNELFDAFPVEIVRLSDQKWQQMHVKSDGQAFHEEWRTPDKETAEFCSALGHDFPEDYTTEFRPELDAFHQNIANTIRRGMLISIDYGFPASHFYDPKRHTGTLQTYHQHQKNEDPLIKVGEQDITAHVDFTHLANSQKNAGFHLHDFCPQHRYLTNHGKAWLLGLEENFDASAVSLLKQFQTLTSPEMMGNKFHILETLKGYHPSEKPLTHQPQEILEIQQITP